MVTEINCLNIEIAKSWIKDKYKIRIGNVSGSSEMINISEEQLLETIRDNLIFLDDKEDKEDTGNISLEHLDRKYYLLKTQYGEVIKGIIIEQSAKEDFKKLMGWNKDAWRNHTKEIKDV